MAGDLIYPVAAIFALGIGAQVLAARLRVPSVVFLITAGILIGPSSPLVLIDPSLVVFNPNEYITSLSAIVGLSVGIIVFEGAFHLKLETLREAPLSALRLVTIGAVISLVGTAVTVRYALGAQWPLAFLVGALLVATGPTVIAPILQVVPVRDSVKAVLNIEGIINDVTAAILAIVLFEAVNSGSTPSYGVLIRNFASQLGIGLLAGSLVAGVLYLLLTKVDLSTGNAPQSARLLTLGGALVAYSGAQFLAQGGEAGIAGAATAGILLGNADLPYENQIERFKGDITIVVLSFVFITLAALLDFEALVQLGVGGIIVVLVVALVIRPLGVALSTTGDGFTLNERAFVSFVGPRGIIPASVATLFALELEGVPQSAGAVAPPDQLLVGTVFLVILATVVFQAGFARQVAEYLNVIPMRTLVIGGGQVGRTLARRLEDRGENVVLLEQDPEVVEIARREGFTVHKGDGTDTDDLRAAGAANTSVLVAATGDDDANLLAVQVARSTFDIEEVLARVTNPDNVEPFEDLGVKTVSSTNATALALDHYLERPSLSTWLDEFGHKGDAMEVEFNNEELTGMPLSEIGDQLPEQCLVALCARDGETAVPRPDEVFEIGDRLTLLGNEEAVREARQLLEPDTAD
jgi:NhaP-type Na+/H+ or K+/H+ antiporter